MPVGKRETKSDVRINTGSGHPCRRTGTGKDADVYAVMDEADALAEIQRIAEATGVTSLAGVLRRGQALASLYLSTQRQINDLAGPVQKFNVKGEMHDWHFISFQMHHGDRQELMVHLIGERAQNRIVTTTSAIRAIDMRRGLVQTINSVYLLRLDDRGVGEPSAKQLLCLCRTLHSCGIGKVFDVPCL